MATQPDTEWAKVDASIWTVQFAQARAKPAGAAGVELRTLTDSNSQACMRFYRDLTGDKSASNDLKEETIDQRVREVLEMEPEEPTMIFDLREVKNTENSRCFGKKPRSFSMKI
jgi:beta-glucosidase-like glycosyl hydrolase